MSAENPSTPHPHGPKDAESLATTLDDSAADVRAPEPLRRNLRTLLSRQVRDYSRKLGRGLALGLLLSTLVGAYAERSDRLELWKPPDIGVEDEVARYGNVAVLDERLDRDLADLKNLSPTFREWWDEIAASEFELYVGTPESIGREGDAGWVGEIVYNYRSLSLLPWQETRASRAFIVIDHDFIRSTLLDEFERNRDLYERAQDYLDPDVPGERQASRTESAGRLAEIPAPASPEEKERIVRGEQLSTLAHEVAHAYDVAIADGKKSVLCDDPVPGQAFEEACVIQRENRVRRELSVPALQMNGMQSGAMMLKRLREEPSSYERLPLSPPTPGLRARRP